jgi:ECF transporter S component (folate family)
MEELEQENKISKFKKYLICLKKGWLIILILTVIGLLTGLIIADKTYHKKYEEITYSVLNFKYKNDVDINYNDIISNSNIERAKKLTKSLETGSKISTYKYVDIKNIKIENKNNYYTIYANFEAFNVSKDGTYSDLAAKGFLKHLTLLVLISDKEIEEYNNSDIKGHSVFNNFDNDFYKENSLNEDGTLKILYSNPDAIKLNNENKIIYYSIWISSAFGLMLIVSLIFIYIFIDKLDLNVEKVYDNENLYRHPFHLKFFKDSTKAFKNVKSLVLLSLLLGMVLICKFIPIPSGFGELGIGFSYLFLSTACLIFGPIPALFIGASSDILGYFIRPEGEFFIGYTIQAMVACFTYALCFHKTYITFTRCLIARVIVNFLCNVIIGSISRAIMLGLGYDAFMAYMLTISLPKNIVYLLPQSLLLFFVLKAIANPLYHMNLIDEKVKANFSFF